MPTRPRARAAKVIRTAQVLIGLSLMGGMLHAEEKPAALVVEAWISTAGPYGESWDLRLGPSGEVSLRVNYMVTPSGTVMARFSLSPDHIALIRAAVESERFFDLPGNISPASRPLHQPALRLDVWLDQKHHTVQAYDPEQLRADPNLRRFLAVWQRLFEPLPIRPSWRAAP
jgi:hypothetical protein